VPGFNELESILNSAGLGNSSKKLLKLKLSECVDSAGIQQEVNQIQQKVDSLTILRDERIKDFWEMVKQAELESLRDCLRKLYAARVNNPSDDFHIPMWEWNVKKYQRRVDLISNDGFLIDNVSASGFEARDDFEDDYIVELILKWDERRPKPKKQESWANPLLPPVVFRWLVVVNFIGAITIGYMLFR